MYLANIHDFPITAVLRTLERDYLDLFVCGNDGQVYTSRWSEGYNGRIHLSRWSEEYVWKPLRGVTSPPRAYVAAVARKPSQLDLFVCGQDGHIYTTWWSLKRDWHSGWRDIGGSFPSNTHVTVVARQPEQLDLFASAQSGDVYTCWWTKRGNWSSLSQGWTCLGGRLHRKTASANVAVVSRNPNALDVFFCDEDGQVCYKAWTKKDGWYLHWRNPGPSSLPSRAFITAVSRRPDQLDIFACASDGQVYTSWWREGDADWSGVRHGWKCLGGHFRPGAHVNALATKPENLELFVIGNNGFMYNAWWNPKHGWDYWTRIRGHAMSGGRTSSVSRSQETLDLFVCDYDGQVYTLGGEISKDSSFQFAEWCSLGTLPVTRQVPGPSLIPSNSTTDGLLDTRSGSAAGVQRTFPLQLDRAVTLFGKHRREEYTVGWICALPVELAAAEEMLDEEHEDLEKDENDNNVYTLGQIGGHNIVLAGLPAGQTGIGSAAVVATQLKATFKRVRFGLMVGIGGGVPGKEDIRLGDVVISQPNQGHGGVIQYDFGKATPSGFERTGFLNSPPPALLSAVTRMRANYLRRKSKLSEYVSKVQNLPEFTRDNAGPDILYEASYNHVGGDSCEMCSADKVVDRRPRKSNGIVVHYGTIASGNRVMKDGTTRDGVSRDFGGVLCFEMEAAGLMDNFPCLVIRGICDYADSHKNKRWQSYAALAAAACAKELLLVIPPADVAKTRTVE